MKTFDELVEMTEEKKAEHRGRISAENLLEYYVPGKISLLLAIIHGRRDGEAQWYDARIQALQWRCEGDSAALRAAVECVLGSGLPAGHVSLLLGDMACHPGLDDGTLELLIGCEELHMSLAHRSGPRWLLERLAATSVGLVAKEARRGLSEA